MIGTECLGPSLYFDCRSAHGMQLSGRDEPQHTEQLANVCTCSFTGSSFLYEVLTFPNCTRPIQGQTTPFQPEMLTNSCAEHWFAIFLQTCKHTKRKSQDPNMHLTLIESLPRSGTRPLTCPGGALETAQPRSPPSSMLPALPGQGLQSANAPTHGT